MELHARQVIIVTVGIYISKPKRDLPTRVYLHKTTCRQGQVDKSAVAGLAWQEGHIIYTAEVIRESVDSLCRDGADTPIVRVHWKAFFS